MEKQVEDKLFCHWDAVRFVSEKNLEKSDGTFFTLSVTIQNKLELMIFLGRDEETNSCYEVKIYKSKPNDKYIPNKDDEVKGWEENDEYATFSFEEYEQARNFVETLPYRHPEYRARPFREI